MKFQPIYRVTIYNQDDTVIVGAQEIEDEKGKKYIVQDNEPYLTCQFTLTRGILSDSNKCTIQLYNLAPDTRKKIFQDAFQMSPDKWKFVRLEAGYNNDLSPIFMGRILQAYSRRTGGQTDVITEIQAQALDMFDCQTSYTFEAGTTYKEALKTIVTTSLPNVKLGNVGNLEGTFQTPTTFDGSAMENISKLTGGNAFIDNDQLNVLMSNEVIDVPVPVITEANGLLETPVRRDANLEVRMVFEPTLIVGQLLEVHSSTFPDFNGQYKVMGFTHNCNISGAQAGQRITTVNLYIGPFLPGADETLAGQEDKGFNKVKNEDVTPVEPSNTGKWIKPLTKWKITSEYGWRVHPVTKVRKFHKGIDLRAAMNTPVYAVADGKIVYNGWVKGYGKYIEIDHGSGIHSYYAHLNASKVQMGNLVKQGQVIALSGNTGVSTGPHLHFGAKQNGSTVNPLNFL